MSARRLLVIACGAIAHELVALRSRYGWTHMVIQCLPAGFHNHPEKIAPAVRDMLTAGRRVFEHMFVAYADCGTGGVIDEVITAFGARRLPGAHCYEFFAGTSVFAQWSEEELGTLYLTDFLARNFERLIIHGFGIDKHPELQEMYFAHYTRVLYMSQREDAPYLAQAEAAARRLGLRFEHKHTGLEPFARTLVTFHDERVNTQG
ncbi:MAG: DUF1638 domain-containing protein [Gammaproteobacteria bacterium]|nr:DUF1638 domain-containing protein [Gammaproteobacteria bacterium]